MAEFITCEVQEHIAHVTICRESALNALNRDVLEELFACFTELGDNDDVKCVILTGSGRAFVAGADISDMRDMSALEGRAFSLIGQRVMDTIEQLGKPVIAAVNGFALGGGCELAMACDIRIASEKAKFGQPEVNLGIIPFFGGTQRLTRYVGKGMAKYLIMTGEMISAEKAYDIGLVQSVVPADALLEEAQRVAETILKKAPVSILMAKRCANLGPDVDLHSGLAYEVEANVTCFQTQDRREGMAAFLEKRPADFKCC